MSQQLATRVFPDPRTLGEALAREILRGIESKAKEGAPYLLGCPGGRSLQTTYEAIAGRVGGADLSRLIIVMMDDYLVPAAGGWERAPIDAHYSCERFALDKIVRPLSATVRPDRRIRAENLWLPDPKDPAAFDRRIEAAGGVDLFLIASGASDGHVAFVPPGSRLDAGTSIIEMATTTRRDNLATFPEFRSLDDVPTHGVSVGLGTILRLSRSVRLVMHGPAKQAAAREVLSRHDFDPAWPASFIYRCQDPALLLDREAAGTQPFTFTSVTVPVGSGDASGAAEQPPEG